MTDHAEARRTMARLMRETADLIERGLVREWEVNLDFGVEDRTDWRTGRVHTHHTGERTVTIVLRGNDFQQADWSAATKGTHAITNDPKLLERP